LLATIAFFLIHSLKHYAIHFTIKQLFNPIFNFFTFKKNSKHVLQLAVKHVGKSLKIDPLLLDKTLCFLYFRNDPILKDF
jgi:hypothetical protein